ncbi:unnamed protein product, partial [Meganyctiphanes norvegica]
GGVSLGCKLTVCTNAFLEGKSMKGVEEGPNRPYCELLHNYRVCTDDQAKDCRGDIQFHSIIKMVPTLMNRNNCTAVLAQPAPASVHHATGAISAHEPPDACRYEGPPAPVAHCGLFGDPHLKTFSGSYQTCGVRGAWPLLNTPELAIQVTNQPVQLNSHATATSKVTVIIKGHENCGSERTYEASSETLPKAFIDGTTWSGGSVSRPAVSVSEKVSSEHILIAISYINATVAVRKIGRYLTVLVTMPETLVEGLGGDDEQLLCVQGCPVSERLDRPGASLPSIRPAMPKEEATILCKKHNVTDYYLDSCIFDLVTTGDLNFSVAAQTAQRDLWSYAPQAARATLKNCTQPPCVWDLTSAARRQEQSSTLTALGSLVFILLCRHW